MNELNQENLDSSSRKKIKENINENYFVEAGAGSGKTTVLVERMVKMIEEGRDIAHISAITFTKAAANEFYERFQKKLVEKSLEYPNDNERYLKALKDIDLAFMGTIDSFCNKIMSEHPNEGLIPSDSIYIDDEMAQTLYKREYANIQNDLYDDKSLSDKAKVFLKYNNKQEKTFILTLNSLLTHRDCKVEVPPYCLENIDLKYQEQIKTLRKILKVLNDNPAFFNCSKVETNDELIKKFVRNADTFNSSWDDNIPNVLAAYKQTFGNKDFRLYYNDEVANALQEGVAYFSVIGKRAQYYGVNPDLLSKIFEEIEEVKYAVTLDFVKSAKDLILAKLRKEGKLTFNDYLVYLRDALRKDAAKDGKLIKHIYERHKYFLIDEFQDTDPIQAEIFFYLAAKDIKPQWKDCLPHKGSLFIVGDPKQSIYRFKNADVASYLQVKEMFKNPSIGEVLYLYENFRSTIEIKQWFNDTFVSLLTDGDDQAKFEAIPLNKSESRGGLSKVFKYDVPFNSTDDSDKDEYKVRKIILKLYQNHNYLISDKKRINGKDVYYERMIDWNDFMLITASKLALANYTAAFREVGIPYYVEGNIEFWQSKAFSMFVDFFGAIINPYDNRYLYKVLKSKLFGISEKELTEACASGFDLRLTEEFNDYNLSENLKNAILKLYEYAQYAKTLSPSVLFAKIINEIEAFKKQGTENMEYVYFVLELLKTKESSGLVITDEDALIFFEKLLAEKNDQERCPGLKKGGNQVHLANLHKVKGLEAPIVILAHPRTIRRDVSFRNERDPKGNKGYLFNVAERINNFPITYISTKLFDDPYKERELASAEAEKLRLEYVAATRAKNVLIIGNCATGKGPSTLNPWYELLVSKASENLPDIELLLANEKANTYCLQSINYDNIEKPTNILVENKEYLEASNLNIGNPSKLVKADEKYVEETGQLWQQFLESGGDTYSTMIGTMVHRLLEMIVLSTSKLDCQSAINNIMDEYLTKEFEKDKDSFIQKLTKVYETINNGGYPQKGKVAQDILAVLNKADEKYCEVPFTYEENGTLWNGIIDLIYLKDNKLHIIDWKTNKDDSNLDEHYQEQLEAYKKAVTSSIGLEVEDALIYHIDISE